MAALPRMTVIRNALGRHVRYSREVIGEWGNPVICDGGGSVHDPLEKIELERAKIDEALVHLRFAYTNKYWSVGGPENRMVLANAKEPDEDKSKETCTLFLIKPFNSNSYIIQHVYSGAYVCQPQQDKDNAYIVGDYNDDENTRWSLTDWETLVKMPSHVAFKAINNRYLQNVWAAGHPFLQFQADDPNQEKSGFQIEHLSNGLLRIKSDSNNLYWRCSPNWVWADFSFDGGIVDNSDVDFTPVKIDDETVALRGQGENHFCVPLSADGFTNCLNAHVSTITAEARLTVQELVLDTKVYNVTYQMDDARIYDRVPFLAGTASVDNYADKEASMDVTVTYEDQKSYSFSRSVSITAGVTATIEADVLEIIKESIQVSYSVTGAFEWNKTNTSTKSVSATGSVPVPARSRAAVSYVATKGSCDVPFHYTQRSTRSTDGQPDITDEVDGIFSGINYYDFQFVVESTQPLPQD